MKQIAALLAALGVCALAIYKATKEKSPSEPIKPPKYSLDWIKLLTDSEWQLKERLYVNNTLTLNLTLILEANCGIF